MTGYSDREARLHGVDDEDFFPLRKPFEFDALAVLLAEKLAR